MKEQLTKVQQLELKLKEAKRKEDESKWLKTMKEIIAFFNKIKGYDFYTSPFGYFRKDSIYLTRIISIENDKYYADCQGFYGQWSKKRFLKIHCMTISIGSQYIQTGIYSTADGAIIHSDESRLEKGNSPVKFLEEGKGFPLGPKKSWSKEYARIIQTGDFNISNSCIIFGDKLINRPFEGVEALQYSFNSFKNNIALTKDKSIFDSVKSLYIKQCKESKELMETINAKKDSFIKPEKL